MATTRTTFFSALDFPCITTWYRIASSELVGNHASQSPSSPTLGCTSPGHTSQAHWSPFVREPSSSSPRVNNPVVLTLAFSSTKVLGTGAVVRNERFMYPAESTQPVSNHMQPGVVIYRYNEKVNRVLAHPNSTVLGMQPLNMGVIHLRSRWQCLGGCGSEAPFAFGVKTSALVKR